MLGLYKQFNQAIYDECDDIGKKAVIKLLSSKGMQMSINPDKYGIDLIGIKNANTSGSQIIFYDAEICRAWKSGPFPYANVHVLERKKKFLKYGKVFFVMIRADLKAFVLTSGYLCTRDNLKPNPNCFGNGEYAFNVPFEKVIYAELDTDGWE